MQFIRQATVVMMREKKRRSTPVIIAPITLVAAKGIASKTTDKRTVPRIPARRTGKLLHTQPVRRIVGLTASNTAR